MCIADEDGATTTDYIHESSANNHLFSSYLVDLSKPFDVPEINGRQLLLPGQMAMVLPSVATAAGDNVQQKIASAWRSNKHFVMNNKIAGEAWIGNDTDMFLHQSSTSRLTLGFADTLSHHHPQLTLDVQLDLDDGKQMFAGEFLAECEGENHQEMVGSVTLVKEIPVDEVVVSFASCVTKQ